MRARKRWCNVAMLGAGGVRLGGIGAGGSPAMTAGCTPPLGGQLHRGTDCRLADLEPGTTTIEGMYEVDAR